MVYFLKAAGWRWLMFTAQAVQSLAEFAAWGKALKCMRCAGLAAWALALGMGSALAHLEHSGAEADFKTPGLRATASYWHEKPGQVSIGQASDPQFASRYLPLGGELMFDMKPQDRVWIRLDVERSAATMEHLYLWIPLPLIDSVTLYQRDEKGVWQSRSAGDRVPVASWPEPGRYPRFHLELSEGKNTLYLQVQGSTPVSLPMHLGSEAHAHAQDREGFLGLGLIIGVLLTLVLTCFVTAYAYQDRLYLLYGLYMMVMILAVGAYTGLAAYVIWDQSPRWADVAQGALAIVSAGGALYFIESLLGGRSFARTLSVLLLGLAAASVPLAVVYCFVSRSAGVVILAVYMLTVSIIGLSLAARAWKQGNRAGKWVFFAYFPLALAVLLAIARAFGLVQVSWVVQYGVMVALLIEAPMMMVALNVRSRDRHEISTREQAMATQDALTGLLKEHIFDDRIRQALLRHKKRREDAAVVLISLVNYRQIVETYGLPVAEQSVLRSVIKLRKVVRDVETIARVGTSHFGLLLEGESKRTRITEMGARLIAQGLMPLPGLTPEVTLQFHLTGAVLRELPQREVDIKNELHALLSSMSRRTRRPIRFLDADSTASLPLAPIPDIQPPEAKLLEQQPNFAQTQVLEPDSARSQWDSSSPNPDSQTSDLPVQNPKTVAEP
ncbi:MAG: diguanylate cyclase [Brachymonas sp.]|nr:diguanylate cyclase [Brachymonas sp.]